MKRREFLSTFGKSAVIAGAANVARASGVNAKTIALQTRNIANPGRGTYDRAYLENVVDIYLEALVSGDPQKAPFSDNALFAENNQRLPLGEASWRTIDGLGRYRHYYSDPETGRVGIIANVYENGLGCIFILTLVMQDQLIIEAEQFVIRDPFGAELYEKMGQPDPVWLEPIPAPLRQSREALEAGAFMYFEAMERNDGSGIYPFTEDCQRIEHGRPTINQPKVEGYGHADTSTDFVTRNAKAQLELGLMAFITRIRDRRAAVIDVERGAVLAQSCFEFDGTLETIHFQNGDVWKIPPYFRTPRTHQMTEGIKVINGSLRYIEMTLLEVPFSSRQVLPGRPMTVGLDYAPVAPPSKPFKNSDRAGLIDLTDQVLDAMIHCCPCSLPLAGNFRYTENGIPVTPGEGLWKTAMGARDYGLILADPQTGQAGWFGALNEYGLFAMLALRLKLEGGLITELEAVITRPEVRSSGEGLRNDTTSMYMAPLLADLNPDAFDQPGPALMRPVNTVSRNELTGAVNRYYQAFIKKDGSQAQFAPGCVRRENGVQACNNPDGVQVDKAKPTFRLFARDCEGELDSGFLASLTRFRTHRPLIVDQTQGLVLDLAIIDNPATAKTANVAGVGEVTVPNSFLSPWTDLHAQLFKIDSGAISHIEDLVRRVPYGQSSGWETSF